MSGENSANPNKDKPSPSPERPYEEKDEDLKLWGTVLFALIGATATTFSVRQLRRSVDLFYYQIAVIGKIVPVGFSGGGEEEIQPPNERIRLMLSVFKLSEEQIQKGIRELERADPGQYSQNFQRDDWYWKTDPSFNDMRAHYREAPRHNVGYSLSNHYSFLGLDRFRKSPYTDAEIKTAFRARAMEFHPDQNQENKEAAEAKFKEVMVSYEAIKKERENMN